MVALFLFLISKILGFRAYETFNRFVLYIFAISFLILVQRFSSIVAPTTSITFPAIIFPAFTHLSSDQLFTRPYIKPAAKLSPAAVVSTRLAGNSGSQSLYSPRLTHAPCFPIFTTAMSQSDEIISNAVSGSLPPVNAAASSSFANTMSTYFSIR